MYTAKTKVKEQGKAIYKWLLSGGLGLMLVCQIFFSLLQISSLEKNLRQGVINTAEVAGGTLAEDISMGLRLGKSLERFLGLRKLLSDAHASFPTAFDICVVDAAGKYLAGANPVSTENIPIPTSKGWPGREAFAEDEDGLHNVASPLYARDNELKGYVVVRLKEKYLRENIYPAVESALRNIAIAMGATVAAMLLVLRLTPFIDRQGGLIRKNIYISFGLLFTLVLVVSAIINHNAFRREYLKIAENSSNILALNMRGTLQRPISKGVPISLLGAVEEYFEQAAAKVSGSVLIELIRPDGQVAFSSRRVFEGKESVPGTSWDVPLSDAGGLAGKAPWLLRTSLSQAAFAEVMWDDILNSAGICVISLTLLFELLLLLCLIVERRRRRPPARSPTLEREAVHERCADLLRAMFFVFFMALDMSITFIPLRMAELPTRFFGLAPDVVMGLPVSAEVIMAGVSIFFAGRWISRQGTVLPMSTGLMLTGAGYLGSALALTPFGFILARAVVGAGYGLSLIAAQAFVFKSGGLANLFAGAFAGSLCGGAVGGMLADKFGFVTTFYVAAAIMLLLAAAPYLLLRRGDIAREEPDASERKTGFMESLKLMNDKKFLALSVFVLLPGTFLMIGVTKYFLPVFLNRADVSQANIGRVYMIYCLMLIYAGPFFGKIIREAKHKAYGVLAGCILSAVCILPLVVFNNVMAMVLCMVFLGLATAVNIPAYSEYLLRLDITERLGGSRALSLLNVVERVGQAAAPIVLGVFIAVFNVRDVALWGVALFFLLAAGFYLTREKA